MLGYVHQSVGKSNMMKRWLVMLIIVLAVVLIWLAIARPGPLSAVYYQSIPVAASGGVTEIDVVLVPEGPTLSVRDVPSRAGGVIPLASVQRFIPDPLPAPEFQWICDRGSDMVITLRSGKQVTYGPCRRPASIDRLWTELVQSGPRAS